MEVSTAPSSVFGVEGVEPILRTNQRSRTVRLMLFGRVIVLLTLVTMGWRVFVAVLMLMGLFMLLGLYMKVPMLMFVVLFLRGATAFLGYSHFLKIHCLDPYAFGNYRGLIYDWLYLFGVPTLMI